MYLLNILQKYKNLLRFILLPLLIILKGTLFCGNKIEFYFQNKKLLDLTHEIAKKKNINIIAPQLKNQAEELNKVAVTYTPQERFIDIDKAWQLTEFFLSMAGYAIVKKILDDGAIFYEIVLNNIAKEPLDIYINVDPQDLPNSRQVIRYIAYLKNIRIDQEDQKSQSGLNQIFKDMQSPQSSQPVYLKELNGYILTDRADIIASIQNIILHLDQEGFQEAIEVIEINYLSASSIANVLQKLQASIKPKDELPQFIADSQTVNQISHFAANLKIITDPRQNSLVIMGRKKAVSAISDFIKKYIDRSDESGKSVLHLYDLQYLDAKEFEPVLQNTLNPQTTKGQGSESNVAHGPFRTFKGVVVKAEENSTAVPIETPFDAEIKAADKETNVTFKGLTAKIETGGNRLLILALEDDWKEIKELIKKLDQPNPQVLIDALIFDVDISKLKRLESTTRSMTDTSFLPSPNTQFISSNITPIQNVLGKKPDQIAQDLLALAIPDSVPSVTPSGALLITINDTLTPGIASIIEVIDQYTQVSIKTHPFLAILNNQKGEVSQVIRKRNRGDSSPTGTGTFTVSMENIDATIKLSCIPHIANKDQLKLDVGIEIETFIGDSFNKITRRISTTSNLTNKQVLAIGGLNELTINNTLTKTPILGSIPIVGNLFKGESSNIIKTSIIILIKPTIIMPRARLKKLEASEPYVKEKLDRILINMQSDLQYNFTDPIIKFFIPNRNVLSSMDVISHYIEETKQSTLESTLLIGKINKNVKSKRRLNFDKIKQNLNNEDKII